MQSLLLSVTSKRVAVLPCMLAPTHIRIVIRLFLFFHRLLLNEVCVRGMFLEENGQLGHGVVTQRSPVIRLRKRMALTRIFDAFQLLTVGQQALQMGLN